MKKIFIKEKLEEIDFSLDQIYLGDFDYIGEFTAKKNRDRGSQLYKTAGCFFRPNYERGILIYALISKFKIDSFLEIGFGRGYATFCAAKAMCDQGIDGKVTTIDPDLDKGFLENLEQVLPPPLFQKITFAKGRSNEVIPHLEGKFDMVYIDGDHTYNGVKTDWDLTKGLFKKFLLFDDYHLPTKTLNTENIECAKLIDEIDDPSKELIIMDRRIFYDDRGITDEEIDYGQVLLTHKNFDKEIFILDW